MWPVLRLYSRGTERGRKRSMLKKGASKPPLSLGKLSYPQGTLLQRKSKKRFGLLRAEERVVNMVDITEGIILIVRFLVRAYM